MKLSDIFENLPGIYIMTNLINGKVYIGESVNIKNRMRKHKNGRFQIIHEAIKKYGMNNFEIYVEYLPDFKKNDLIELEKELIIKFNCQAPNGYNLCSKSSNWIGRKHTKITKEKMSKDRTGDKHVLFGTKWSKDHLEKKVSIKSTELENISNLYLIEMLSTVEIGKIYGVSHNSVYRFLKRNGIQPRKVNEYIKPKSKEHPYNTSCA